MTAFLAKSYSVDKNDPSARDVFFDEVDELPKIFKFV